MKKLTAVSAAAAAVLALSAGSVFAQTAVQASSSASIDTGGLGTGLTHMVKDILRDSDDAPVPVLTPSAAMMQSNGVQLKASPAPAARSAKVAPQAQTFSATTLSTSAAQQSDADVSAFIGHLLQSDPHVRSIDASDSHVRVTYVTAARIFGLIRVDMPVTGEAYVSGSTDVTYPWYGTLAGIKSDIKSRFDARIASQINADGIAPEARIALIGDMQAFFAGEFSAK